MVPASSWTMGDYQQMQVSVHARYSQSSALQNQVSPLHRVQYWMVWLAAACGQTEHSEGCNMGSRPWERRIICLKVPRNLGVCWRLRGAWWVQPMIDRKWMLLVRGIPGNTRWMLQNEDRWRKLFVCFLIPRWNNQLYRISYTVCYFKLGFRGSIWVVSEWATGDERPSYNHKYITKRVDFRKQTGLIQFSQWQLIEAGPWE